MTDAVIDEIWDLVTSALDAGQKRVPVHIFPFRMTEGNFAILGGGRWDAFWRDLKPGYDQFEVSRIPPKVSVCAKRYAIELGAKGNLGSDELSERCPQKRIQQL